MNNADLLSRLHAELASGAIEIKVFYNQDGRVLLHVWTLCGEFHGFDWNPNA